MCSTVLTHASDCDYLMCVDSTKLTNYRVQLQSRNASLDGVCAIKIIDSSIRGVVVNDFGIKAFAFSLSPDRKKVKLQDVIPMLDHWYIKRVLKNDLKQLFNATTCDPPNSGKKTKIEVLDDGTISVTNSKYHINYLFTKAPDIEQDEPENQDEEQDLDNETTE